MDFRQLLDTLNTLETSTKIDEAQNHEFLNDIVDKYAKDGMTLDDLSAMEQEADSTEPPRGNFLQNATRRLLTRDFRKKYVLAHASEKLDLPGLYNSEGSSFYYLDDEGEAQSARGANRIDATEIHAKGLLPNSVAERFNLQPTETDDDADDEDRDSEADTDSTDNGAPAASEGGIRLSDGTRFDPNNEADRNEAARKLNTLITRYNELIAKMNESAPVSLRGYLREYNLLEAFLAEALSNEERDDLRNIISDINALIDGNILSQPNTAAARQAIANAPDLSEPSADDVDSADSGTPPEGGSEAPAADEVPPAAAAASDASGDQDARVEPGEGRPSGSLEAFARSGKGGLANDADEVDAINELQQFLTDLGFDPRGVDGKYGPGTVNAVKAFQGVFGARQDGDAGPETIGKIIEYRNDIAKMDELIAAAGQGAAPAQAAPAQATSEGRSWRDLITLVENMFIAEALSDQQRTEAEALIEKYEALVGNLPEPAKTNVQEKIDALKAALEAPQQDNIDSIQNATDDDNADDEGGSTSTQEPRSAAEIAADPDGDGNADDPEAQTFISDTPSQARQLALAMNGPGTDEEKIFDILQSLRSPRSWQDLKREYQEDQNEDLMTRFREELNATDMQRYVLDPLGRLGINFDENGNEVAATAAAPAAGSNNVAPRPAGSGRNVRAQQATWDRRYAATHNPDGTPKAAAGAAQQAAPAADSAADAQADDAARQAAPAQQAAPAAGQDANARMIRYLEMPRTTPAQVRAFYQALRDDTEVFNRLDDETKAIVNAELGS